MLEDAVQGRTPAEEKAPLRDCARPACQLTALPVRRSGSPPAPTMPPTEAPTESPAAVTPRAVKAVRTIEPRGAIVAYRTIIAHRPIVVHGSRVGSVISSPPPAGGSRIGGGDHDECCTGGGDQYCRLHNDSPLRSGMLPARNPPEAPLVPNEQNRRFALILRGLVTAHPGRRRSAVFVISRSGDRQCAARG